VKKLALAALTASLALASPVASAQLEGGSGKWGSFELGGGPFRPRIDKDLGTATPYRDVFGGKPAPVWRLHLAKAVWDGAGVLEAGFKTGFFSKSGHALETGTSTRTGDRTTFNVLPTSLTLTYRPDFLYERYGFPLLPYGRVALERYNWWTTKESKWTKKGATNGWSATAGLALVIDFLDPDAGRDLDREVGVNHTALYFDVTKSKVDDFGSKKSLDLSEDLVAWSGGLLLVF
jgi:hypothetical protein